MTGVATIRGLLERFDALFVEAALACPIGFIDKVQASAVFALAPPLLPSDGLLLVDALEARATKPAEPQASSSAPDDSWEPTP
jgi:hypothetical protein